MYSLIEHILEFTAIEEGIKSYWILSNGKKIGVPDQREHIDVIIAQPSLFKITPQEILHKDTDDILALAIDRGAIRATHNNSNGELTIISKNFSSSVLDSVLEFAPGETVGVMWETPTKFVQGSVEEVYNRL